MFAHGDGELGKRRPDVFDAFEFLGRVIAGHPGGLLGVLGIGGGLPSAVELDSQTGGLFGQLLTQIPELVRGLGHLDTVRADHLRVGGVPAGDLLGLRLGGRDLGLQRTDAGAGPADLRVEGVALGLGEIELTGDVAVLVLQLVDGAVQRLDLGRALL